MKVFEEYNEVINLFLTDNNIIFELEKNNKNVNLISFNYEFETDFYIYSLGVWSNLNIDFTILEKEKGSVTTESFYKISISELNEILKTLVII